MDMSCPRCSAAANEAGHEDGRAYFTCARCGRIWSTPLAAMRPHTEPVDVWTPRVLIVDDSDEMVRLLAAWLEDEGCDVITAGSGWQALDAAAIYYPDVVFLDLVMPPPDGVAVARLLKARLSPEVVFMTGLSSAEYRRRGTDADAVVLLEKPFSRETAVEALVNALDRCRRDPLSRLRAHFGALPRLPY
jgi:DNA-binding response OmpR family regulator